MTTNHATPEVVDVVETTTAVIRAQVPMAGLADFFDGSFSSIAGALAAQGVTPTGPAFARYYGEPAEVADLEVGFPTDRAVQPEGDVRAGSLPGGRVARLVHAGSFDQLGDTWGRLRSWIDEQGLTAGPALWEVYVTEPTPEMDPADLRTELNWSLIG